MKLSPEKSCEYMGRAIAEFDFEGSGIESVGFALLDKNVFRVFSGQLPGVIAGNAGVEFSTEAPRTVAMPWRSF